MVICQCANAGVCDIENCEHIDCHTFAETYLIDIKEDGACADHFCIFINEFVHCIVVDDVSHG